MKGLPISEEKVTEKIYLKYEYEKELFIYEERTFVNQVKRREEVM